MREPRLTNLQLAGELEDIAAGFCWLGNNSRTLFSRLHWRRQEKRLLQAASILVQLDRHDRETERMDDEA